MLRSVLLVSGSLAVGFGAGWTGRPALRPAAPGNAQTATTPARAGARPDLPPAAGVLGQTADFLARLEKASVEDLPAMWEELAGELDEDGNETVSGWGEARKPGDGIRTLHRALLARRWATLDAPGGRAFLLTKDNAGAATLPELYRTWGQREPDLAAASAAGESGDVRGQCLRGLLAGAADDPAQLVRLLGLLGNVAAEKVSSALADSLTDKQLAALRKAQPGAVTDLASRFPDLKDQIDRADLFALLQTDPAAAARRLAAWPWEAGREAREEGASQLIIELAGMDGADPLLLAQLIEQTGAALGKSGWLPDSSALADVFTALARTDPDRAAKLSTHLSDGGSRLILGTSFAMLAASDPAAALRLAPVGASLEIFPMELPPIPEADRGKWLAALETAPPSWHRDAVTRQVLGDWAQRDPAAAQAWIASLPPGEFAESAAAAASGASEAAITLNQLAATLRAHPEDESLTARARMAGTWLSQLDPQASFETVSAWPPGPERDLLLAEVIVRGIGRQDEQASLAWSLAQTDPGLRSAGLTGTVRAWGNNSPQEASVWVDSLPDGADRQAAAAGLAKSLTSRDPEAALTWAATLTDPAPRMELAGEAVKWWTEKSGTAVDAARTAINALPGYTPEEKETLLRRIP